MTHYYDVKVKYDGHVPDYIGRVVACDEEQAKRLAFYDATAKGWPRHCGVIEAKELED